MIIDTLRVSPVIIYVIAIVLCLLYPGKWSLGFLGAYYLVGWLARQEQLFFESILPKIITKRPDPPAQGCDMFSDDCKPDQTLAFPSAHSQTFFFVMGFVTLWCAHQYKGSMYQKMMLVTTTIIFGLAVCWSRWKIGCHTPLQLSVGSIIGLIWSAVSYLIISVI